MGGQFTILSVECKNVVLSDNCTNKRQMEEFQVVINNKPMEIMKIEDQSQQAVVINNKAMKSTKTEEESRLTVAETEMNQLLLEEDHYLVTTTQRSIMVVNY